MLCGMWHVAWVLLAFRLALSRLGRWPPSLNRMPANPVLYACVCGNKSPPLALALALALTLTLTGYYTAYVEVYPDDAHLLPRDVVVSCYSSRPVEIELDQQQ